MVPANAALAVMVGSLSAAAHAEPEYVLYRVNAGGEALPPNDKGPLWMGDNTEDSAGAGYRTSGSSTTSASIDQTDLTVPPSTNPGIFLSERFDRPGSTALEWDFPVQEGVEVEVRLYFANSWSGSSQAGQRTFDVSVDGQRFLSSFDVAGEAGHRIGTMRSFTVVSDGTVDVDFGHRVGNPMLSGIEVIDLHGELRPKSAGPAGPGEVMPSPRTRFLYVSSSRGDDANDGRTPRRPKATIEAAAEDLRDGAPDWLLLRRGDAWEANLGDVVPNGASAREPVIIAPYGSGASPRVVANSNSGAFPTSEHSRMVDIDIDVDIPGFEWTSPTPSADSIVVYVSRSEGNDSNSGMSPTAPVRTIDKAYSLLRDGHPDWILVKRGDVFDNEGLGRLRTSEPRSLWTKSGRSEAEPMVVSTYGEGPRPVIMPYGEHGMQLTASHVRFIGLEFNNGDRETTDRHFAVRFLAPGVDVEFVDVLARRFSKAFVIQANNGFGEISDVLLYRCVVLDSNTGRSSGAFLYRIEDLKIVECVFDHNGWLPGSTPSIFNHNIYTKECYPFLLQDNILSRGANFAATSSNDDVDQLARDLTFRGNLLIGNGGAFTIGKTGPAQPVRNIVLEGNAVVDSGHRWALASGEVREGSAFGFDLSDANGISIAENVFLNSPETFSVSSFGVRFGPQSTDVSVIGNYVSVYDDWAMYIDYANPDLLYLDNTVYGGLAAPDGTPTLEAYDALIGGAGTIESFIEGARNQSMADWQYEYTPAAVISYLRGAINGN